MKTLRSFAFAWNGLRHSIGSQSSLRIHLLSALVTTLLGFFFHLSLTEWMVVLVCFALVLFSELMNTALEKLCDVVEPNHHIGIKLVKDISAAAVLVSASFSALIGMVIFLPRLIHLVQSL